MAKLKYFERIQALIAADEATAHAPLPPFDFESLGSRNPLVRGFTRFALRRVLPVATFVLRQVCPNPRFGRVVLVTRAQDAKQVLEDQQHFNVVYKPEMIDLGGGFNNVLGMDGAEHEQFHATLQKVLRPDDFAAISQSVAEDTAALLAAGDGRIDVMRDLISRTASEAACRYFGLTVHDADLFGQWTMAVSNQLFGDFTGDANTHRQAKTASAHLASVIDDAIARVKANNRLHPDSPRPHVTLIDRLVTDENVSDGQVRATILGLATAFVPTNTLAAGNMLEVLLETPRLLRRARDAASTGDATAMREVLLEAGRLNPALSPGLWRHVPATVEPAAIGRAARGGRKTRPGDLVLVCIPSALRARRGLSGEGWPLERLWMMFGAGPHVCWGAQIALAHLVSVFTVLFRQPGLRPAPDRHGAMLRTGPYPTRMDMIYDAPLARRGLAIVALPVRPGVDRKEVETALDALGNPARPEIEATLSAGDRVQFASLSVIPRAPDSPESIILLELSGDGDERDLLDYVARQAFPWLGPIVSWCRPPDQPIQTPDDLAQRLRAGFFELRQRPWGPTGVHFDGLGELSVADIARQERVAHFARQVVDQTLTHQLNLNTRAMGILLRTRRLIRGDSFLGLRDANRDKQDSAVREGLRGALLRPGRKRLAMADWQNPRSLWPGLWAVVTARDNLAIPVGAATVFLSWFVVLLLWILPGFWTLGDWLLAAAVAFVGAAPGTLLTLGLPAASLVLWLSWQERHDPVDDRGPTLEHVEAIARREDAPGRAQNHIIAVMPLKPGPLRRLSFAFALWGIRQAVTHFFRPGFVVTMGTIHKARWFRVPGTEQFVFFSNYDGSWQSYLEDFITRAHQGQSAAWSHGVGFPRTRLLIQEGAADGDRFKRWVRLQQRETRFWYSRFPNLTAQQIRDNAMIEDGLARATSDTDARRWLANFGSAQRGADELETQEAQSIVFSGFSGMTDATALMLRLPQTTEHAGAWLSAVSGLEPSKINTFIGPPKRWQKRDPSGRIVIHLPLEARVLFGDQSAGKGGAVIGLTAKGLKRCGLSDEGGLSTMPTAFRMTMGARAPLLGDAEGAPDQWRFTDRADAEHEVEAMLILYGHEDQLNEHGEPLTHADLVRGHEDLLRHFFGHVVHKVECSPVTGPQGEAPSLDVEPFGFRDGISQPVIRGTRRAAHAPPDRDLVAAGEFLLGYRNQQGYLPPPVTVGAERDPGCDLPTISAADTNRYPYFGNRTGGFEVRDFGRNGTFVAVRQLDQDVPGFWAQAERVSQELRESYPDLAELAGNHVSGDWVAAKMIGRWPDGTPLVGHQERPAGPGSPSTGENDYAYGVDDPRGLACPLGAHIRRSNPRDSQEPGDPDEQQITNRHRLLRRGRAYRYAADGDPGSQKTGLLFMALCADLERQFEFVQRTWINATAFHGLVNERDPLLNQNPPPAQAANPGVFTIPTAAGPIRVRELRAYVEPRGGAYFFLPSRSALAHLVSRSLTEVRT